MKRWLPLMLLLVALPVSALELAGVAVENTARVGASDLALNGAGIRTRAIFKVYVDALLRIWLGDKPIDGDLKKGMLGQAG